MSGIDKILERIASDSKTEAEARLAAGREKAAQIRDRDREQADEIKRGMLEQGSLDAEARYDRLCGTAQTEAGKALLMTKQELISEAFENALTGLAALPDEDKITLGARLIADASRNGEEEVILTPSDHTRFGKKLIESADAALKKAGKPANLHLSAHPRPLEGGGGLVLRDGDVEVNCSYGALVAELRDTLTPEVAKVLFG